MHVCVCVLIERNRRNVITHYVIIYMYICIYIYICVCNLHKLVHLSMTVMCTYTRMFAHLSTGAVCVPICGCLPTYQHAVHSYISTFT